MNAAREVQRAIQQVNQAAASLSPEKVQQHHDEALEVQTRIAVALEGIQDLMAQYLPAMTLR